MRGTGERAFVSLAGQLLLAHPSMGDPHFRRTVVLLSTHDAEGAFGLVVNQPTGQLLGAVHPEFAGGPHASIPVYSGGPVQSERLILAAWHLLPGEGAFRLFVGIEPERIAELQEQFEGLTLRAFQGYSGWTAGQLEQELKREDWLVQPIVPDLFLRLDGELLWRRAVGAIGPRWKIWAEAPDDPAVN